MKRNVVAFCSGALFAIGLLISGMTRPSKVIGFLDLSGNWDPSLAFVMLAALAVHFLAIRWAVGARSPLLGSSFQIPTKRDIDAPLVAGAALFGIGWGLAGYCPGPAVTSVASLNRTTLIFMVSMLAGMVLFGVLTARQAAATTFAQNSPGASRPAREIRSRS